VRDRPGLNALLEQLAPDAAVVVAESLDRLSRDQEDIAAIFKRCATPARRSGRLSEGEVGELHIGLRGTMAAMVRKDTADKVKRGLTGRALAGMNPGGMAYGYRKVPKLDDRGEPVRGLREIDEDQAAVIRRIFAWFAQGPQRAAICGASTPKGFRHPAARGACRPSTATPSASTASSATTSTADAWSTTAPRTSRIRSAASARRGSIRASNGSDGRRARAAHRQRRSVGSGACAAAALSPAGSRRA
jgi:hypothetical protein